MEHGTHFRYMKYIITVCLLIPIISFSQSIDEIVYSISDSVSTHKTDSLAKSLDSTVTFNIITKDNSPTNVYQLTTVRNSEYFYDVTILGINTANGDVLQGEFKYVIKNISGNYGLVRGATVMSLYKQGTVSPASYGLSNNGTIVITGVKNLIMKWVVKIDEISHLTVP